MVREWNAGWWEERMRGFEGRWRGVLRMLPKRTLKGMGKLLRIYQVSVCILLRDKKIHFRRFVQLVACIADLRAPSSRLRV